MGRETLVYTVAFFVVGARVPASFWLALCWNGKRPAGGEFFPRAG